MIIYIGLFLLIIFLFYFINKFIFIESFEDHHNEISNEPLHGAQPNSNGNDWNLITTQDNSNENKEFYESCSIDDIGNICSSENGFGIINKNCECIIKNNDNLQEEEDKYNEDQCNDIINNMLKMGKLQVPGLPSVRAYAQLNDETEVEEERLDINNSHNYVDLDDINRYFNGIMMTPCLYKSEDFDTWCKFFNSHNVPKGYNKNSLGSAKILKGLKGLCFTNGKPDPNKARAICGYNSMESIDKLEPVNDLINYNKFTNCLPLKSTNFKNECSKILNTDISNSNAVEIMGYDCNPQYGRAKCIYGKDNIKLMNNIFNSANTYNDNINKNCPCS